MNAQAAARLALVVDGDIHAPASVGVRVHANDADLMTALGDHVRAGGSLQSIFRVSVAGTGATSDLPDVVGRYQLFEDGVRFKPHFPFERGLSYRASFDPLAFHPAGRPDELKVKFSLPEERGAPLTEVTHVFPSSDELPENLLRFYVCFSSPMQRGRAGAAISVLGPDGEPVSDVLYRAPVELWDRSMRCPTVLLDPGRLKRGVGPNRELGPPLKVGHMYTLAVDAGMTDLRGRPLPKAVYKRFRVVDPVREPIAVERWETALPTTNSHQPLALTFPRPLDWALLSNTITVWSASERAIDGKISIDQCERRWRFTPVLPWTAGSYRLRVASSLEDICGNDTAATFDRPLRSARELADERAGRTMDFRLGVTPR